MNILRTGVTGVPICSQEVKGLKVKGGDIALNVMPISQLLSIICHIGSHIVTCHQTLVNVPYLNPSQIVWYSICLPRRDGRLS